MLSRTAKTLCKALLGLSVVSVALTGCSGTEAPTGPTALSTTAAPGEQAPSTQKPGTDIEKASQSVVAYADAVRTKSSQGICDLLDPAVVKVTLADAGPDATCVTVFDVILQKSTDLKVPENIDAKALSAQGKKVSETMYSFPLSAITPGDASVVFVTKVGNDWKIGLDPQQAEAVKQIEKNNPTNTAPTSSPK